MAELITSTAAAKLLGVRPTTVKRWADSGELPCVKTAGGHRRFDRALIERRLRRGGADAGTDRWGEWIAALTKDGDPHLVRARIFAERARLGAWHRVAHELGDLLRELGERWAAGKLSVIEEHVASAALERALAAAAESIPVAADAPRCLLASAEDDEHTLGLSLAELCVREAGWRAEWAGRRTRTRDLLDRLKSGAIRMLGISASLASTDSRSLRKQARAAGAACRAEGTALALGGEGCWPDELEYGVRFRSLEPFYRLALERRSAAP